MENVFFYNDIIFVRGYCTIVFMVLGQTSERQTSEWTNVRVTNVRVDKRKSDKCQSAKRQRVISQL